MSKTKRRNLCIEDGCNTRASFNYSSEKRSIYCGKHRKLNMINVNIKKCLEEQCIRSPHFNYAGETKGIYCKSHCKISMINVVSEKCLEENCNHIPYFNYAGETKGIYCKSHCKIFMIDVKAKKCLEKDCEHRPCFNYKGEAKGIYCSLHKHDSMVNVYGRKCLEKDCERRPYFNYKGKTKGIYCGKHRKSLMIDVINRKCLEDSCNRIPYYNYEGEKKGIYCSSHKLFSMIDVLSRRCLEEKCTRGPCFNYKGETKGIYCLEHKLTSMVNVYSRKCLKEKCNGSPNYNYKGKSEGIYCSSHKMVSMIDVVRKRCEVKNCNSRIYYGFSGHPMIRCAKHKLSGMLANCTRNCKGFNKINGKQSKCSYKATHGVIPSNPEFCEVHAPKEYFALTNRVCKGCKSIDVLTNEGLCFSCDPKIFKKRRLAKQRKVQEWLDSSKYNKNYKFTDKTFPEDYECFKRRRRPDFLYDCNTHFVILEVDENQHNRGKYNCETKRMGELAQALGLPTIFIRYNPDEFKGPKGRKIFSTEFKRKKLLLNQLSRCKTHSILLNDSEGGKTESIENFNKDFIIVLYLYYDGFDESLTPNFETLNLDELY